MKNTFFSLTLMFVLFTLTSCGKEPLELPGGNTHTGSAMAMGSMTATQAFPDLNCDQLIDLIVNGSHTVAGGTVRINEEFSALTMTKDMWLAGMSESDYNTLAAAVGGINNFDLGLIHNDVLARLRGILIWDAVKNIWKVGGGKQVVFHYYVPGNGMPIGYLSHTTQWFRHDASGNQGPMGDSVKKVYAHIVDFTVL